MKLINCVSIPVADPLFLECRADDVGPARTTVTCLQNRPSIVTNCFFDDGDAQMCKMSLYIYYALHIVCLVTKFVTNKLTE